MPTQAEVNSLVEEILEIPTRSVSSDSNLEELGWDSLSNVTFISIADERYARTVDASRLNASETPAHLLDLLA